MSVDDHMRQLVGLAQRICKHQRAWSVLPAEPGQVWIAMEHPKRFLIIEPATDIKRVVLRAWISGAIHGHLQITCALSRGAEEIYKDLMTRLMPVYDQVWAVELFKIQKEERAEAEEAQRHVKRRGILNALTKLFPTLEVPERNCIKTMDVRGLPILIDLTNPDAPRLTFTVTVEAMAGLLVALTDVQVDKGGEKAPECIDNKTQKL